MLARRKQVAEESANNDGCPHALNSSLIRLFNIPVLKLHLKPPLPLSYDL